MTKKNTIKKQLNQKVKNKLPKKQAKRDSFREWQKNHRKGILIAYYSIAGIIATVSIMIIFNNIIITDTVEHEETAYYSTEYIDDNNLELGTEEVEQEGIDGIKKVYYNEKKRLLSGEIIDSELASVGGYTKEPVKRIIRRGTKKWQYMVCSDGYYLYFTDEQFQEKNIGFTHASDDYCSKDNHGSTIALSDNPPTSNMNSNNPSASGSYLKGGNLSETYVSTLELIQRKEMELRESTEKMCRKSAEEVKEDARSRLDAKGADKTQYNEVLEYEYNTAYYQCMNHYGY